MKKLCALVILLTVICNNSIYSTSDTPSAKSSDNTQIKQKKSTLSSLSAINGISTLAYYLVNIKFVGGSTFFLIFGILRHIFKSKANQSELKQTQLELDETKRRVGNIENQIDLQLETIKNEITQLKDILSKINESMVKQTENTELLKEEVNKIQVLSQQTDTKVTTLEENTGKMTHLIQTNSDEITLQKNEIEKATTLLTNLSQEIIELKQFDMDHKKAVEAFTQSMELNSQTINLFNENIGGKIEEIKDDSKQINTTLRNLVEKNQDLEILAKEQYNDTKTVVLSLKNDINKIKEHIRLDQN